MRFWALAHIWPCATGVKSMEWFNNLISGENGSAINLVLITLAIAFLLIVIVWVFRKITGTAARRAMRSRVPRLSITDSTTVDDKRYLVMVRRDNVEHLLLIGGANDLVVEKNIVRAQTSQKPASTQQTAPSAKSEDVIEEEKPAITAPVASAAALGTTGIAAATAITSSATDTVSEAASNASDFIADTTSDITESISDTATVAAASAAEQSSEAIDTAVEAVSLDIEPEIDVPEIDIPELIEPVVESVEMPEADLESTISAQLDDALSGDALKIDVSEMPEAEAETVASIDSGDDEMQRLLNELSGEVKEPAQ